MTDREQTLERENARLREVLLLAKTKMLQMGWAVHQNADVREVYKQAAEALAGSHENE